MVTKEERMREAQLLRMRRLGLFTFRRIRNVGPSPTMDQVVLDQVVQRDEGGFVDIRTGRQVSEFEDDYETAPDAAFFS